MVTITFEDKEYKVIGIATIIAIKKHCGYGKRLMTFIRDHIEKSGSTAIGFCNCSLSSFYLKCGYKIIKDGQSMFIYSTPPKFQNSDVIYLS